MYSYKMVSDINAVDNNVKVHCVYEIIYGASSHFIIRTQRKLLLIGCYKHIVDLHMDPQDALQQCWFYVWQRLRR